MRLLTREVPMVCLICLLLVAPALSFEPQSPAADQRCPVCGMFVARHPEWVTTFVLEDGGQIFFDGAGDMFRHYFRLPQGGTTREDIVRIYVTEYYTARFRPVEEVFFVLGSDVHGPMGAELVPVGGRRQAEVFMRDHGGSRMVTFDEVTPAMLPGARR